MVTMTEIEKLVIKHETEQDELWELLVDEAVAAKLREHKWAREGDAMLSQYWYGRADGVMDLAKHILKTQVLQEAYRDEVTTRLNKVYQENLQKN